MPTMCKAHVVHFFENHEEYCTFLKIIINGMYKHKFVARATFPAIYGGVNTGYIGYAEKYEGIYGSGWRVVIFRPNKTTIKGGYNHVVKYYIREDD